MKITNNLKLREVIDKKQSFAAQCPQNYHTIIIKVIMLNDRSLTKIIRLNDRGLTQKKKKKLEFKNPFGTCV